MAARAPALPAPQPTSALQEGGKRELEAQIGSLQRAHIEQLDAREAELRRRFEVRARCDGSFMPATQRAA